MLISYHWSNIQNLHRVSPLCVCARARVYIQRERHEWERENEDSTHQCRKMRRGQKQYGIVITFFGNFFYKNLKSFQTKVT